MKIFCFHVFSIATDDIPDVFEVTILLDFMACTIMLCAIMLTIQVETVELIRSDWIGSIFDRYRVAFNRSTNISSMSL